MRETDCANTEGIFRIIQSIPSPKAEPFKRWLARVDDSHGLPKLKDDAKTGGGIAGGAREKLEERIGKRIVTKKNHLKIGENGQKELK